MQFPTVQCGQRERARPLGLGGSGGNPPVCRRADIRLIYRY